jgi:hypothetical protein
MDNPPLDRYDELATHEIASRARALDETGVTGLLRYEREHADRPQVILALEHRLEELKHGAQPTDGDVTTDGRPRSAPTAPEQASPQTQGPPQNPPSQGVPSNPAQPRT